MLHTKKRFDLSPKLKFGVGRGIVYNQFFKFSSWVFIALSIGLSANVVRVIYKQSSTLAPKVLGASIDTTQATSQTTPSFKEYTVIKGDTLFNISQKFNISWTTLATLNNLSVPFNLKPGQTLQIPTQ